MKFVSRKLNIYGDFWLRYLYWSARNTPAYLEPIIVLGFISLFYGLCIPARRGILANLRFVFPRSSWLGLRLRGFHVFWNFAWTLSDLAHTRIGRRGLRWEVAGIRFLNELESSDQAAILMTAHMGNYDIAAPIFSERCHRPIHMVRSPERESESRSYQDGFRGQEQSSTFFIHYNEPGNMLGVELAQCLKEGALVAIQGDRVLFDVSSFWIPFYDASQHTEWRLPRGPFVLAAVARAPMYPIFILRRGYRSYRIEAHEPLQISASRERGRDAALQDAAKAWSRVLSSVVRRHWSQWFVFEPMFQSAPLEQEPSAAPGSEIDEPPPTDLVVPPPDGSLFLHPYLGAAGIGVWWWLFLYLALPFHHGWGAPLAALCASLAWFPTIWGTMHLANLLTTSFCHLLKIAVSRPSFPGGTLWAVGVTLMALRWTLAPPSAWSALGWLWLGELALGAAVWALGALQATASAMPPPSPLPKSDLEA